MTSQDNAINTNTIVLLLNSHFDRTERILSEMRQENAEFRREMKQENEKFRQEMRQEFKVFKDEVNTRFDKVDARFDKVDARFERLETQVAEIKNDVTGLKHDVAGLYHWNYWQLSIIIMILAMPQIIAGVKSLFGAVLDSLSGIVSLFRKN